MDQNHKLPTCNFKEIILFKHQNSILIKTKLNINLIEIISTMCTVAIIELFQLHLHLCMQVINMI